ncbi:MAG: hypothetical protein U0Z70_01730 [Thermomicrobiales bacterium]
MEAAPTEPAPPPEDVVRRPEDGDGSALPFSQPLPTILDRTISLGGERVWQTAGLIAVVVAALVLRLTRLNAVALNPQEAPFAYDAWVLYRGQPPVTGEALPNVGAFLLLLQGACFFLFGATDVVARLAAVIPGVLLVLAPLALRRWVGGPAALGMAVMLAISPTLVYASRVINPEVIVALCAAAVVAAIVALARAPKSAFPAAATGIAAGVALGTGPSALTVAITLIIGLGAAGLTAPRGTIADGLRGLRQPLNALWSVIAFVITVVVIFTRLFSYPAGIAGFWETLGAWRQLLFGPGGGQPVALFLLVLLVYELLALLFALVALTTGGATHSDALALFAVWGLAAFCLWSFSAGRAPEQAIHVVLPITLLAGIGVGETWHAIQWRNVWHGISGVLGLAMLGVVIGLAAVGVLLSRANAMGDGISVAMPPVAVLCLVVVPLVYLIWRISDELRHDAETRQQPVLMALLVASLLLGAFGYRSANLLAFERGNTGFELLAQQTSTEGTLPTIKHFLNLSRDVGINAGTPQDPTGSYSLSIEVERDLAWPYVWYFRDFPNLSVVDPGAAGSAGAQAVLARDPAVLEASGYRVTPWPWRTTVPPQYLDPDVGDLATYLINPTRWLDLWKYLLFRRGIETPAPEMISLGLTTELASRVQAPAGPFALGQAPGPGTEPGQFKDPVGVAVAADGTTLVVDSGNARVERFREDGSFLDIWGQSDLGSIFTRTANGLGPTGITVAPDGQTWVADTWGHRVVALDANGQLTRTIGGPTVDLGDDPARVSESPGSFFGPRAVAISDDAIYIVDTGNERVQKFAPDGTFERAWGGYGSDADHLIEPVGVALGPDGNVYVADSGNARISIFTPDGEPVAQWPVADWPPPDQDGIPPAFQPYLAFDAAGNLYASASNAGEIVMLNRNGEIISRIANAGAERLAQPLGVAVAPGGNVLITDAGRDAVFTYVPIPDVPASAATPVG